MKSAVVLSAISIGCAAAAHLPVKRAAAQPAPTYATLGPRPTLSPYYCRTNYGPCGGFTRTPLVCPSYPPGLICIDDPSHPYIPDLPGICVLPATTYGSTPLGFPSNGLYCGGNARPPRVCPSSQQCLYPNPYCKPPIMDCPGLCISSIRCAGCAGKTCPNGMSCWINPDDGCDPSVPGADCQGWCVGTQTPVYTIAPPATAIPGGPIANAKKY
ncbi:hypothetical protein H072_10970 [Dactylellina haptotyla CBS 200.50]|uniref:IGFBP N-terminal domain-containing protein n=1 Tax=Dactylellina haptotyla (strain CBS 200.50) TaxID=1284197 RepID=S7ZYR9_DACHA|nr:hypothetical protein H072_10970 [Dactylellina haptotyla CBS 200.50]